MKRIIKYLCAFLLFIMCTPLNVFASLNYVGCGSAEGIPQPLVQLTRMMYTFLVVITPIILITFSVIVMIKALKEDNADEILKAKTSLVKRFIAAGIILLIGIVARFILTQVATNKDDKNTAIACMSCFLYNKDCHTSSTGNNVKREFHHEEEDSTFIIDTKSNRDGYKTSSRNSDSNPGKIVTSSSNVTTDPPASNSTSNPTSNSNNTDSYLTKKIQDYINSNSAGGKWAVYVKNFGKNDTVNINADEQMNSASVIKLFILGAVCQHLDNGTLSETDDTLMDNIRAMITKSDNNSTNSVLRSLAFGNSVSYGFANVNNYADVNGWKKTKVLREFGGARIPENLTSARDVGEILEKIYNKKLPRSDYMLELLKAQQRRSKIPAGIPSGVTVANKTGEHDDIESDSAIVYAGGDYVIVVLSNDVNDTSKAANTVKEVSKIVYEHYK